MTTNKTHLKIGLVLDDTLDTPDGVQQYVLTLGRWLSSQGHTVRYLTGQSRRQDLAGLASLARNVKVSFNGNRLSLPLPAKRSRLRQLISEENFDVLHIQTPYSPFLSGKLLRYIPDTTAVVGTFHILPYSWLVVVANKLLALYNRHSGRRFDIMIANSAPSKKFADLTYHFNSQIIPNPFPLVSFQTPTAKPNDVPTIVFLGRLVERKGALQLLRAIAYMRKQQLYAGSLKVVIGGKGPLTEQLKTFAKANQLTDIVSFPGFVAESDKTALLASADIAVFPSISGESFGISLLEAMAASRGVVLGGDNPGYRSVLAPLNENRLIDPSNSALFAQVIAKWLGDPKMREQAALAQKSYVKQFDIAVVGPQIVETYHRALRLRRNVR